MPLLYSLFILSALFFSGTEFFRPEYALVGIGLLYGVLPGRSSSTFKFHTELIIIGLMFFSSGMSIVSQTLLGYEFIWRDAMIFTRLAFYAAVIVFAAMAAKNIKNYKKANILLIVIGVLMAALSFAQYVNFMNINTILLPASGARYIWLQEGSSWRRVLGTLDNPNYWGLALSMVLSFIIYRILWQGKLLYLPLFFALITSIFLTGSRTSLICTIGGPVIGGLFLWHTNKEKPRIVIALIAIGLGIIFIAATQVTKYYENENRYSTSNIDTLYDRISLWERAWEASSTNPIAVIFGRGPRKGENVIEDFVDNTYVRSWQESGLLGLGLYLALVYTMIKRTLRLVRDTQGSYKDWSRGLLFLLFSWSIFGITADAWLFVRTTSIILGMYIFIHSVTRNEHASLANLKTVAASFPPQRNLIYPNRTVTLRK